MMVGIPGAGKSFFARNFAKVFQVPLVSFDEIQHILFASPSFSKDEEVLIANVMRLQINQLLRTHKTFIIDGGLSTRASRLAIERLARENDFSTLSVWIQTDETSAEYRVIKRSPRRAGDIFNYPMTIEQFMAGAQRVTPPDHRERHIVISGKHTFASQAQTLLKKIVKPRSSQTPVRPTEPVAPRDTPSGRRTITLS